VSKSSNHTLTLHKLASNSCSTTNFPWLSPTDNSVVLLQFSFSYSLYSSELIQLLASELYSLIFPRHGPRSTENTAPYCCRGVLPHSCLANSLGANLPKAPACITSSVVWHHRACVNCGHSIATAVTVTYRDTSSIVACGHHLATADVYRVTSQQRVHTPQYTALNKQETSGRFIIKIS
jgi:hypothetical protein